MSWRSGDATCAPRATSVPQARPLPAARPSDRRWRSGAARPSAPRTRGHPSSAQRSGPDARAARRLRAVVWPPFAARRPSSAARRDEPRRAGPRRSAAPPWRTSSLPVIRAPSAALARRAARRVRFQQRVALGSGNSSRA
jgi:hypothetical protein